MWGQAGFVPHLCAPRPPVLQLEKHSPLQEVQGSESENAVAEGDTIPGNQLSSGPSPIISHTHLRGHQKERTEAIPYLNNTSDIFFDPLGIFGIFYNMIGNIY